MFFLTYILIFDCSARLAAARDGQKDDGKKDVTTGGRPSKHKHDKVYISSMLKTVPSSS